MGARTTLAGAALVLAAVSGCSEPDRSPLRVGLLIWPAYELPYLAQHLGYYEGLDIRLVEFRSPAEVLHAYQSGGLDAIAVTTDYLVELAARDPAHRAVMVVNVSHGADALLARPEVRSLADLRGRRVGVEHSALGRYVLSRALDHGDLSHDDIEIVSVDYPDTPQAYRLNRVAAVVTYEPYRTRLLALGAVELFSSRDIPGEIVDVLVARADTIESRSNQLHGLVDGWLRAVEEFNRQPRANADAMLQRNQLTFDQYHRALAGMELVDRGRNRQMLEGPDPNVLPSLQRIESTMRNEHFIDTSVRLEQLIDARFIEPRSP